MKLRRNKNGGLYVPVGKIGILSKLPGYQTRDVSITDPPVCKWIKERLSPSGSPNSYHDKHTKTSGYCFVLKPSTS
jgi:hypothetical protein